MHQRAVVLFLLLATILSPIPLRGDPASSSKHSYRIGVLAKRGEAHTLERWNPTAQFLTRALAPLEFTVVPLDFEQVEQAAANGTVDFLLTNPAMFVTLENRYRLSRIATMRNSLPGNLDSTRFGGVIFTRADRIHIQTLDDLRGKRFLAVDEDSLGGWFVAWREFKKAGIDPYEDFKSLGFAGTHDRVVHAVRKGHADAGSVRTDVIERMALEGKIDPEKLRILNPQNYEYFPMRISTELYPEWPFARLADTPAAVAGQVAVALLKMKPGSKAAQKSMIGGWTVPLDYTTVHQCLEELGAGPYTEKNEISIQDVIDRYGWWLAIAMIAFFIAWGVTIYVLHLNTILRSRSQEIHELNENLEQRVEKRTRELHRFQWIVDTSSDFLCFISPDAVYREMNQTSLAAHGLNREQVVGKHMGEIFGHSIFREKIEPNLEKCSDGTIAENEYWYDFPVLGQRYLHVAFHPFMDDNDALAGYVLISHDITDRKKAEDALHVLRRDLEIRVEKEVETRREKENLLVQQSKMAVMGEMLGAIAHQWSQPLNSLSLILQDLSEAQEFGELDRRYMEDSMEKALAQLNFMAGTVEDFRNFLKPSREKIDFPVKRALDEIIELLAAQFRHKSIEARYVDPPADRAGPLTAINDGGLRVLGYENEFKQALLNILNNAKDSILSHNDRDSGWIDIWLARSGKEIIVSIVDSGQGIEEDKLESIFDPYVSTKGDGMGFGLYMTRTIIESNMEGQIRAYNMPGGACIEMKLPLFQETITR